VIISARPIQNL